MAGPTDFYVYHSDGTSSPLTPFESEVQTLIPLLDAEDGGAATVTEVDPGTEEIKAEHQELDILGSTVTLMPCVVAERNGVLIRAWNVSVVGDLDPPTLLDPGGPLAQDTLDTLETQKLASDTAQDEADERSLEGAGELAACEQALLFGDLLTPDAERSCLLNLVRGGIGLEPTDSSRFVVETEVDLESFASDLDGVDGIGTGGSNDDDSIKNADFVEPEGFLRKVGPKVYEAVKSNLEATVAPGVSDDVDAGYAIGSRWIDQTGGIEYVAKDVSSGAAVWIALGAPAGGEDNLGANVGTGANVFKDKTGVTLNMRSLTTPGDELAANVNGDEVELTVGANLNLESLQNVAVTTPQFGQTLVYDSCNGGEWKNSFGGGGGGGDPDAIHDNVDAEISVVTEKASPVGADVLLIEDSAASYAKKRVQITNLPGGADADAIHDNVASEISAVAEKVTPVSADLILIEDSEAANVKKKVQVGNLPGGGGGEANTASNANVGGIGVWDNKDGVDLEMRGINALSTNISVTLDAGNKKIDLDVPDGSTTVKGVVELATDGEASAGVVVQGDDSRLSDARTPTAHALGGAEHSSDTLANLNAKITDATLIDTADSRLSDARTPTTHAIAGSEHSSSTLANLNTKVSDATLIDTGDSRLSDARTPTSHASSHQNGGSDEIAVAAAAVNAIPKAGAGGTLADGWIAQSSVTQHEGAIDHDALTNYAIGEHRIINDAGTSTTELWSASKISTELAAATGGLDPKDSVETVADSNITLSGEQTLNGYLTSTSRVGVVGQTAGQDNGIYTTGAGAWTRTADFDEDAEVTQGAYFFVGNTSSTKNGFRYILTTADPITVGTTSQSWTEVKRVEFGTTSGTAAEGNDARIPTQDENDALAGTGTPSAGNVFVTNDDGRLTDARTPTTHAIGGSEHSSSTLAQLNALVSDATLIDTGDSRLSDARTPTSHAASHQDGGGDEISVAGLSGLLADAQTPTAHASDHVTGGADKIRDATAAQDGLATASQITKLDGVEALADVTDATNVAAAGAVMDSDITEAEGFVRKTGVGAYEAIKTNLAASTDPGTGDDSGSGYAVGSRWINTTLDKEFVCLDASAAAAVWTETTGGGATWDSLTGTASLVPFNTGAGAPAHGEGKVFWDATEHALVAFNDSSEVTQQLGQEGYIRVYNSSGVTITNGSIVYVSGSEGVEFRPTIDLARADLASTSEVIGWATHDIENSTFGYVCAWGLVNDLDTSAVSAGDTLFLDETTAGTFRNSSPPEGSFEVICGYCIRSHATLGRVLVQVTPSLGLATGDAQEVVLSVQKGSAGTINPGQAVYASGFDTGADVVEVELARSDAAGTMPAIGIARDTITQTQTGTVIVFGTLTGQDTSGFTILDPLYIDAATAGDLTATKPAGANLVQKVGTVLRAHVSQGVIGVSGAGRTNDLPNLASGQVWLGNGSGVPTETSRSGVDDTAIHDDVTGEIAAVAEKVSPVGADVLLIEDSAAGNAKKRVQITNLPGGADADAIHDNVAAEISAVTEKATPVSADLLLIEDSADSNNKKRVQIGNLPGGGGDPEVVVLTVRKGSAGTISTGQAVYLSGWDATNSVPEVETAANGSTATMPAIGVASGSITNAANGTVQIQGLFTAGTSAYLVGDRLYVNAIGNLTDTKPAAGSVEQVIGVVTRSHITDGEILIGSPEEHVLPRLATDQVWLGNGTNLATSTARSNIDDTAIHDNATGELNALTNKASPAGADLLLIEDSATGYSKKKVLFSNISSTDADAIHDNVNGEIDSITELTNPGGSDLVLVEDSAASYAKKKVQLANLDIPGVDSDAFHFRNVSNELASVSEKVTPVSADLILIEDSAAAGAKKRVQVGNLPGGASLPVVDTTSLVEGSVDATKEMRIEVDGVSSGTIRVATMPDADITLGTDADAIHDNVNGEINAITEKTTPVNGDWLLIEDSAASNAKKKVQVGNLPGGGGGAPAATIVDGVSLISTTSTTAVVATSMTITPASGTYLVTWTATVNHNNNSGQVLLEVYSAGSVASQPMSLIRGGGQGDVSVAVSCQEIVTVNGSQAIEGRWRVVSGTGEMRGRILSIVEVT